MVQLGRRTRRSWARLLPITQAERDDKVANGLEALERRFDEAAVHFLGPAAAIGHVAQICRSRARRSVLKIVVALTCRTGQSVRVTTGDGGAIFDAQRVLDEVVDSLDQTWTQFDRRLSGLDQIEYLWEPVPGCWSVHDTGDGRAAVADWADPDPDPAPVTTIAWRMWHIAVDCLDSYSRRRFDGAGRPRRNELGPRRRGGACTSE